jgi:hypothetical protein
MHSHRPALVFIALAFVTHLAAQSQSTCKADTLPSEARSLVSKKFPGWRLKRTSDLVGYDQELWVKAHPKECPGIAVGHFESPDQTAYMLLLIPKSGTETGYKIVVLSKSTTGNAHLVRVLDHAEGQPGAGSGLVISKVPPGKYSGFDSTRSVRVKLDAIEAEWLEKSSVLYFWKNGKYRTQQTSD